MRKFLLPSVRVLMRMTGVCVCLTPLSLRAAPGPSIPTASAAYTVFRQQTTDQLPADSTEMRNRAETAQKRFERIRRRLMPSVWNGGSHPCHERIGRFCLWYDGEDDWVPSPDPPELVQAREELLATMAASAERISADEWILGQRIRYLVEAGQWDDAVHLARRCGGADVSWCSVLEGFALHVMGRYEAALEGFRSGLRGMDPEEAWKWRDPSILLDRKGADVLDGAADEDAWEELRARVWTLADPLYLVAGNDRESEHYARWTFSKISDNTLTAWGMTWGDDLEEITLRYGWNRGWEQTRLESAASSRRNVIGHRLPEGREFAPPWRVLQLPSATMPGDWIPEDKRPRTAHTPAYVPTLLPGVAQVAVFPRGDQVVVVAATQLPTKPEPEDPSNSRTGDERVAHGLVSWPRPELLDGPERFGLFLVDEAGHIDGVDNGPGEGALHLEVPAGGYLMSVEAWAPEDGLGGRIRHGISTEVLPNDLTTLSDLVLLHPRGPLPQALVSALPSMRPSLELEADSQLVLGWEVFGLGWRQEDVSFKLSFSKENESFFGRIGRWLGLGEREVPLQLGWNETGPSQIGPWFRSVEVTIPEVEPGKYVFRLEVTTPGREELVQTRLVEIVR